MRYAQGGSGGCCSDDAGGISKPMRCEQSSMREAHLAPAHPVILTRVDFGAFHTAQNHESCTRMPLGILPSA